MEIQAITAVAPSTTSAVALQPEPIEKRVRNNDKMTIAASLRQVNIERMAMVGRPSEAVIAAFLEQLDANDANVITNIVKYVLQKSVRSCQHVMNRFRYMVRAAKCIRLFWLASRFRLSHKIQRLILQWKRDEDDARRHLLSRSKSKKQQQQQQSGGSGGLGGSSNVGGGGLLNEDDFVLQQFISLQAPTELKRRVLLKQYHKLSRAFRSRWRAWRQQREEAEAAVRESLAASRKPHHLGKSSTMHGLSQSLLRTNPSSSQWSHHESGAEGDPHRHAAALRCLSDLPPEPTFKWFEGLSTLTAAERFELCLQLQLRRGVAGGSPMVEDDGWIALSLASVARHARQIEERSMAAHTQHASSASASVSAGGAGTPSRRLGPSVTYLPRFTGVRSKVHQHLTSSSSAVSFRGVGRDQNTVVLGSLSTELRAMSMRDLKAELPTLAAFKGEAWNLPPRPQGHPAAVARFRSASTGVGPLHHSKKPQHEGHRTSESPTLSQLDPFAKSLALRGIMHPPLRPASGSRSSMEVERRRAALMAEASVELSAQYHNASTDQLLRGDRFMRMVQQ